MSRPNTEKAQNPFWIWLLFLLFLLAVIAALLWRMDNPSLFPRDDMYYGKNPNIDYIRVYTFDADGDILLGEVTDPELIQRYIAAHRWEDPYRICCDEVTAYAFREYAGEDEVGCSKLPRGNVKYNNRDFAAVQREMLQYLNALPQGMQ